MVPVHQLLNRTDVSKLLRDKNPTVAAPFASPYNFIMTTSWSIRGLRQALAAGMIRPSELAEQALAQFKPKPRPQHVSLAGCGVDSR